MTSSNSLVSNSLVSNSAVSNSAVSPSLVSPSASLTPSASLAPSCTPIADGKWSGGDRRGAPPYHAKACAGSTLTGLDGCPYVSAPHGDSYLWVLANRKCKK